MPDNKENKAGNTQEVMKRSVFSLAWPIFFQSLLGISLGYADTVMLSNYSDTAVGAIGNANSILGFLALAFTVISSATGVMVSQYLGAKQKEKMNKIYTVAISFNLVLSVLISLVVFIFSEPLLRVMQVPDIMMPDANMYMQIVGGTIFTQAIFNAFSQIFSSHGKTKIGMVLALAMNIINIAGNFLFLYGPLSYLQLGTSGVAISTCTSRIIILIIAVVYFYKVVGGRLGIKYVKPFPKDILKEMLKLGIPTAGENISYNCSQLVLTAFVNTMGIVAINTRIYANMLSMVTYMFAFSAAIATQIIVGHSVGAGDYDFAYKRVLRTLKTGMLVSISVAVANWLLSPFTFRLFSDDPAVAALGSQVMFVSVILEFGRTTNIIIINSMKAAGDVKFPTAIAIVSMWGLSVVLSYLLGIVAGLGLVGVLIAMAADEIFRGIAVLIRWKRGTWRGKRVVTE